MAKDMKENHDIKNPDRISQSDNKNPQADSKEQRRKKLLEETVCSGRNSKRRPKKKNSYKPR